MENKPLVSVLITSYNREKYIAEAIESVLQSTYSNFEIIITDNCSEDKSYEIAKSYEAKDKRINVYLNEKNLGQFPNRNLAASYAKGKYIKYLDSDDIIYPHGLETMVNAMEQFPEAGIGLSYNSYDDKKLLPILFKPKDAFIFHFTFKGLLYIGPSGCIYKKEFFLKIGEFNDYFKVAADYEFNLRATNNADIVLFNRDLIWWRQHNEQEIVNSSKNDEYIVFNYLINKKSISESKLITIDKEKIISNNKILMGRRLLKLIIKLNLKRVRIIVEKTSFPCVYFFRCLLPTNKL